MVLIGLIKFTNMLVNGKRIAFGDKESFLEINKYFFKEILRKVWSMVKESLNMITEMFLKETILKIKKEEKGNIILAKDVFYNHNLILILLKYQKFI